MIGLLKQRLSSIGAGTDLCFAIVYPDGSVQQNCPGDPSVRLVVKTSRVALRVLLFGYVGLLESYFAGEVDVDGDFARAFGVAMDSGFDRNATPLVSLRNRWHELRYSNRSKERAKHNACFHYDLGEPFYRQWLDRALMMYTCAYWQDGCETVEQAQRAKVEHVCRKIRLPYDRELKDILKVQDEITMKTIMALQIKLTEGERASLWAKYTNKLEAYLKFLEGVDYTYRGQWRAEARPLFEEAIALDPKFAPAYSRLA